MERLEQVADKVLRAHGYVDIFGQDGGKEPGAPAELKRHYRRMAHVLQPHQYAGGKAAIATASVYVPYHPGMLSNNRGVLLKKAIFYDIDGDISMASQDADIYFIRHGQSTANLEPHIINGRGNHYPLSLLGEQQASLVGPWLLDQTGVPDAVFASPAVRTLETARLALEAAGLDLTLQIDDDLQEMSAGDWTGLLRDDMYTPEVQARIEAEQMDFKTPGGESMREVAERKLRAVERLQGETVWVFGHGAAIRCMVGTVLGWPHAEMYQAKDWMYNASITHLARKAGRLSVPAFAMVEHLPEAMLTL